MVGICTCTDCANGKIGCVDCCTSPFTDKDPGFWLTLTDVARIVKKTGMNPEDFCHIFDFANCEDDEDDSESDEVYGELMCIGDKTILMKGKDKKCIFLNGKGCSIFDSRPKMCQIHPFWFKEEEGKIKITVEHEDTLEEDDCYLTKSNYKCHDISILLNLINETEESMEDIIKEYIEEMKLHDKVKHQLEKKSIMDVLKDNGFLD